MADQTGQTVTQTPEATQATGYKFPMSDASQPVGLGDDWDILFDENGRLDLRPPANLPSQQQAVQEETKEEDSNNLNSSSNQQLPASTELTELKQNFEKLASLVVGLVNGNQTQQRPTQEQTHTEFDINEPGALQKLIVDTVKQALAPYQQDLADLRVRSDYSTLAVTHGDSFKNAIPKIAILMKSDPNLSFETAYQAIQQLEALNTNGTPKQDSTTHQQQPTVQKVNAQQIAQKVNQLSTDSKEGIAANTNGNTAPVKNLNDALDRALASVYGR